MTKLWHKEVKNVAQHQPVSQWQRKNLNLASLASVSLLITTTLYCFLADDLQGLLDITEQIISELKNNSKEIDYIKVTLRRNIRKILRKGIKKRYKERHTMKGRLNLGGQNENVANVS